MNDDKKRINVWQSITSGLIVFIVIYVPLTITTQLNQSGEIDELENLNESLRQHQVEVGAENEWLKNRITVLEEDEEGWK